MGWSIRWNAWARNHNNHIQLKARARYRRRGRGGTPRAQGAHLDGRSSLNTKLRDALEANYEDSGQWQYDACTRSCVMGLVEGEGYVGSARGTRTEEHILVACRRLVRIIIVWFCLILSPHAHCIIYIHIYTIQLLINGILLRIPHTSYRSVSRVGHASYWNSLLDNFWLSLGICVGKG